MSSIVYDNVWTCAICETDIFDTDSHRKIQARDTSDTVIAEYFICEDCVGKELQLSVVEQHL